MKSWMKLAFCEVFDDYTSRCRKIPKEEYLSNGKYIVIDQGQNNIAGYTNIDDGLFEDVPAIVFGDHTRIIKYVDEPFFLGADGVKLLKSKIKDANYKYLYYVLRNARIPDTGYNRHFKWLKEINLEYKDAESQKNIVKTLDTVTNIIELYKVELSKLDNLIRARFVEMFGDPQINHFGWDVINISEVINGKVSNGFFAKRDDYVVDGNVSILGVSNIVNRMYSKIDGLPKTNANNKDIAKFEVKYGDMLFCRSSLVAEGIGKASIIPEDIQENVLFECHVIRLPLDLNKCVPEFMQTLSSMEYFRNQIIAQSKTATMTTIGQDGIIKTEIILPPINKQREYYQFVKEVNKSKFDYLLIISNPYIQNTNFAVKWS